MNARDIKDGMVYRTDEIEIDFQQMQDVVYWAKKWEISPGQLIEAANAIQSNEVKKLEAYLREKGFAI